MSDLLSTTESATAGRVRAPLVFGGIPEAEGWVLAPITARVRVHFRVDRELPLTTFRAQLPDGVTVTYDYDAAGNRTSQIDALGNAQHWVYDDLGQLTSYTNARGQTTTHAYNVAGDETGWSGPDGPRPRKSSAAPASATSCAAA